MKPAVPVDQNKRDRALDTSQSFIVQAPAGSGKTELLIRRFLRLLTCVDEPEEVIAITFTRKAAAEMRERVLKALKQAHSERPDDPHKQQLHDIASAVIQHADQRGWSIEQYPARLRIQTIDALSASIARQMPWQSGLGGSPSMSDDPGTLYREAAQATAGLLEEDTQWSDVIADLLMHLDNNVPMLVSMLEKMLAKRDQWLQRLSNTSPDMQAVRIALEEALERSVIDALDVLQQSVPAELKDDIAELACYAGDNLASSDSPIAVCAGITRFPGTDPGDLDRWKGITELLLVKNEASWRVQHNVKNGIPADKTPHAVKMKEKAKVLREALSQHTQFCLHLHNARQLPDPTYEETQWQALQALIVVLPLAAAQLRYVFAQHNQVDFIEVALSAVHAFGDPEEPTDLTLALDYRISHILVDEFQDTSYSQYELLAGLTAGWETGDGRTLFLVGDPMQSIYRFRQTEVSLYLHVWKEGIGDIRLEPLQLGVNFRSEAGIVEWINDTFPSVLSGENDISTSAVSYLPFEAHHPAGKGVAVNVHPFLDDDRESEANKLVELVQGTIKASPKSSIAILVRSRSHLMNIIPALNRAGLQFRAVDLESLGSQCVIQDLMSLTRALVHPADRVAWLAILRSPWCGLLLSDLHALVHDAPDSTILDLMNDEERIARLSADGKGRLSALRATINKAITDRQRKPLRNWIENTWTLLGGPACIDQSELEYAGAFFDCLESISDGGDVPDLKVLNDRVDNMKARANVSTDAKIDIMTMHRAKGLEFDTVILPGLARQPHRDDKPLLAWSHRASGPHAGDVLLAPVHGTGAARDSIYEYICSLESEKSRMETGRLLYVAVTRARKHLHLLGHVKYDREKDQLGQPGNRTLLAYLWHALAGDFKHAVTQKSDINTSTQGDIAQPLMIRRLPSSWQLPQPLANVNWSQSDDKTKTSEFEVVEFVWAGETARHTGTIVHRYLNYIAQDGLDAWPIARIERNKEKICSALMASGVPENELDNAVENTMTALLSLHKDDRANWILSREHSEARSEYGLTTISDDQVSRLVVDRTFVDPDNVRWIIDYKVSRHTGGGMDDFLDQEMERYKDQLERYAEAVSAMDSRPIRLGLYFPLLNGWREWSYQQ